MGIQNTIDSGLIMAAVMSELPKKSDAEWELWLKEAEVSAEYHGDIAAFGDFFVIMHKAETARRSVSTESFDKALADIGPLGRRFGRRIPIRRDTLLSFG